MTAASAQERQALRAAVAALLVDHCSEEAVRAAMATPEGYDPKLWGQLAQLGVQGLLVDAGHGGGGSTFEEVAVVLEELGRALYPGPLLATTLAVLALNKSDDKAVRDRHLPAIATGDLIATVAVEQPAGGSAPSPQVRVSNGALEGFVPYVLDGHLAQLLLVATDDGLYAVEPGATGVTAEVLATTDQTRRLAKVSFDGTPGVRIGGDDLVAYVLSAGAAALAAEQAGGAEAVLHSAVAYATVRTQFGRAIGSFQAIKHHCSDMFLGVESAKAAARRAAREIAQGGPELAELAAVAKAWCSDTYSEAAATSLQIHGGVGFTWEHPAHLHLKRAKTDELLFGDARHHRARLADALGV
ncbi:MAG: putative acyl-CoA dehydrogenase [Frankiales bacterium]|nr:putative acyl-CoA dehydrogenase [Frankiales bacterium]